jgi:hypothetical protein
MENLQLSRPNNLTYHHFAALARSMKDPRFPHADPIYRLLFGPASVQTIFFNLVHWMPKSKRKDNAVYKSARELARETGYSSRTIERATSALHKMGFSTFVKKANGTPTTHYTFDLEKFFQYVASKLNLDVERVRAWMGNPVIGNHSERRAADASGAAQNGGMKTAVESETFPNKSQSSLRTNVGVDSDKTAASITTSPNKQESNIEKNNQESPTNSTMTLIERITGKPPEQDNVVVVQASSLKMEIHSLATMLRIQHAIIERWVTQYGLVRVKDIARRAVEDPKVRNPGGWAKLALERGYQWAEKVPEDSGEKYITGRYAAFIKH